MRIDRFLIALALAVSTASAMAGTVCVQNKQTGRYEPKNPAAGTTADCSAMNQIMATAIAQPTAPVLAPSVASTALVHTPTSIAPGPAAASVVTEPSDETNAADPATRIRKYRLKFADVTVRLAVKRWLKEVNMQLAYEAQKDFPVPVEGDYTGPVSDVMLKLMTSLSQSTYPLRACEYDNRVVLIVHRDEKCPLEDQ